jgi:hypothetical protein
MSLKEHTIREGVTDKDISSIKMEKAIMEITLMTSEMVKVCLRIKMAQYMKLNGRITGGMELER